MLLSLVSIHAAIIDLEGQKAFDFFNLYVQNGMTLAYWMKIEVSRAL